MAYCDPLEISRIRFFVDVKSEVPENTVDKIGLVSSTRAVKSQSSIEDNRRKKGFKAFCVD